jgi:hypothetical protein
MAEPVEITRYSYHLLADSAHEDVVMFLYDRRSTVVAEVGFVTPPTPLPPPREEKGKSFLYFRRDRLADVVDMLRNEGPVALVWRNGATPSLCTGYEPVGEGEFAALGAGKRRRRPGA